VKTRALKLREIGKPALIQTETALSLDLMHKERTQDMGGRRRKIPREASFKEAQS
jgi:hypothetical protein